MLLYDYHLDHDIFPQKGYKWSFKANVDTSGAVHESYEFHFECIQQIMTSPFSCILFQSSVVPSLWALSSKLDMGDLLAWAWVGGKSIVVCDDEDVGCLWFWLLMMLIMEPGWGECFYSIIGFITTMQWFWDGQCFDEFYQDFEDGNDLSDYNWWWWRSWP